MCSSEVITDFPIEYDFMVDFLTYLIAYSYAEMWWTLILLFRSTQVWKNTNLMLGYIVLFWY